MNHSDHNRGVPVPAEWLLIRGDVGPVFRGFERPNTVYVPNQFFDVCLPHCSGGAVRLVAYLLRQTLGWLDADGNPLHERVALSYRDLVEKAGISRRLIRAALDEAVEAKFIRCVRQGKSKSQGQSATTAQYELRWSTKNEYTKNPKEFDGFFAGDGHRTDIPNGFFDHVLPRENLSVTKVVGSILRFTVGFKVQRGGRRQQVAFSYRAIQRYARINDMHTISAAIQHAIEAGYLVRLKEGRFDPKGRVHGVAATYAVKWSEGPTYDTIGSQTPAKEIVDRFTNPSEIGSQTPAKDRFTNPSIEMTYRNNISKQQQDSPETTVQVAVAVEGGVYEKLREVGFDGKAARTLADRFSSTVIENQIAWLPERAPVLNPLGMLRRAIEENWSEPATKELASTQVQPQSLGAQFAGYFFAGLGGNVSDPTAEPSAQEIAVADRFVSRLLEVIPDSERVRNWGRTFGQLVRDRRGANRQPVQSLVLALRLFGDEFFSQLAQSHRKATSESRRVAWEKHERDFQPRWLEYLATTEANWRENRPEDYAEFQSHREREREKISRSKIRSLADSLLRRFDTDESRVWAFQRYFPQEVLDFAAWDRQINPEGFPAEPVRT